MGIRVRVEYVRSCDAPDCDDGSDSRDVWDTSEQAELAAVADGWVRLSGNRWICPECWALSQKREAAAAKGT
jgi:hypothetical protein